MTKLPVTLGLLVAIIGLGTNASALEQPIKVEFVSSKEMKGILTQYPKAIPLQRKLHVEPAAQEANNGVDEALATPDVVVQYYLGGRIAGDYVVARDQQNRSWGTPQNVQLTLNYPASGTNGKLLTYINIVVTQSNYGGQAYVLTGGIGYRYVRIVVEAYNTYIFNHNASFYGI